MNCLPRIVLMFLAVVAGYWSVQPAAGQDTGPAKSRMVKREPQPLTAYKGRRIAQTMHYTGAEWLTRDNREQEERCSLMLTNLGLKARSPRHRPRAVAR